MSKRKNIYAIILSIVGGAGVAFSVLNALSIINSLIDGTEITSITEKGNKGETGDTGLSAYGVFLQKYPGCELNEKEYVTELSNHSLYKNVSIYLKDDSNNEIIHSFKYPKKSKFTDEYQKLVTLGENKVATKYYTKDISEEYTEVNLSSYIINDDIEFYVE